MTATAAGRSRRPLTPEHQALAERYLPLARALARPYKESWPDSRDEFESAACLALVQAAESYRRTFGVKFSTHAANRIKGALKDVLRGRIPRGYRDHPEAAPARLPLGPHAEERGRVLLCEPDPPVGRDLELAEEVGRQLRSLPTRHAAALRRIYLHGDTHARAAIVLGCSESRVQYLHREALDMLRGTWGS